MPSTYHRKCHNHRRKERKDKNDTLIYSLFTRYYMLLRHRRKCLIGLFYDYISKRIKRKIQIQQRNISKHIINNDIETANIEDQIRILTKHKEQLYNISSRYVTKNWELSNKLNKIVAKNDNNILDIPFHLIMIILIYIKG